MRNLAFASALSAASILAASGCSSGGHQGGWDAAAGAAATGDGAAGAAATSDGPAGAGAGTTGAGTAGADAGDATDGANATLPDFADGTRLKALAYVTDQGEKLWHGWRDSQRVEDCTFGLAADGQVRCLPAFNATPYFTDDTCKVPLLLWSSCQGAPPAYVAEGTANACGPAGALHELLDKIPAPAAFHYVDTAGACASGDAPPGSEYWVAAAAPEPDAAFVAAHEIRDGRGAALMARYYQGDDGSLQLLGPYDRAAAHACAPPVGMSKVCAPEPLTMIQYPSSTNAEYLDATCTTRTAVAFTECEAPSQHPELAFGSLGVDPCSDQPRGKFYRLGAQDTARPFLKNATMCAQTMSNKVGTASDHRFVLDAEIPPSAFPEVRTVDDGAGRFRVRTVETPDGQHLRTTLIFDSVQNGTCTPTRVGDTLRCLPDETIYYPELYRDDACTQRVYINPRSACAGPKFVKLPVSVACGASPPRYFEVGAVVTPTPASLFFKNGDQCGMYPVYGEIHDLTERPLSDAPAIGGA
jgi:hypothetical protein